MSCLDFLDFKKSSKNSIPFIRVENLKVPIFSVLRKLILKIFSDFPMSPNFRHRGIYLLRKLNNSKAIAEDAAEEQIEQSAAEPGARTDE